MIHIIGDGVIPEARALYDVQAALDFDQDVYLLSHVASAIGVQLSGSIIYNMEPLSDECRAFTVGYMDVLRNNTVLDYSRKNVEYLKNKGVEAFYMPYGHHKELARSKPVEKDIDVLFVGSFNKRRSERTEGVSGLYWVSGVYGSELDDLIARANVVLNVHYSEDHPLEVVRLNYLLANGCNVVSERGNDPLLNKEYEGAIHWVDGDINDICKTAMDRPKAGLAPLHDCMPAQAWLNELESRGALCLG